jgi:hypothetical protein
LFARIKAVTRFMKSGAPSATSGGRQRVEVAVTGGSIRLRCARA